MPECRDEFRFMRRETHGRRWNRDRDKLPLRPDHRDAHSRDSGGVLFPIIGDSGLPHFRKLRFELFPRASRRSRAESDLGLQSSQSIRGERGEQRFSICRAV